MGGVRGQGSGVGGRGLLELLEGWGHLDVLTSFQSLLTLDQVVDAIDDGLHQLDLRDSQSEKR